MMVSWFERNLEVLQKIQPDLAKRVKKIHIPAHYQALYSKTDLPVLRVGKITLHSLYDPVLEGERWAVSHRPELENASAVVVLGFGMGYHLQGLLRMTDRPIWVLEPHLEILRAAMEYQDLAPILSRVKIGVGREEAIFKALRNSKPCIFVHGPSRSLDPSMYDAIKGRMKLTELGRLKILVVYPIYGGSLPVAHYCTQALQQLGHQVVVVDYTGALDLYSSIDGVTSNPTHQAPLKRQFHNLLSEMALARCLDFQPDLVLALAQAPLVPETLDKMRQAGIVRAYWFVEDFRLMGYWKEIAPHYDYFFVIQRGEFLEALKTAGVAHGHYLPMAMMPEIHRPLTLTEGEEKEYGSDLAFLGAGYYNRQHFFQGLLDMDFKIWGSDWNLATPLGRCIQRQGARISTEDCVKIFNAARININLHSSTYHRGINPEGDFVNPRTFEIAACGRFQLVDERAELQTLFEPGHEVITFKDLHDLREKIRYYLGHPEEAAEIAAASRERVLSEHTYQARMEEMLGLMLEQGLRGSDPAMAGGESVDKLIAEAGPDTTLGTYLSRFKGRQTLSLQDIVKEIREGEGRLSEPEAVFLLMNELAGNR